MARQWKMPEWMEPYRELFSNTGGNSIEELMSGCANVHTNAILAMLQVSVEGQVSMLVNLHERGLLK